MQAYRMETTIQQSGALTVQNLPLQVGDDVEVIILVRQAKPSSATYSLRGLPVQYEQPTEPVAEPAITGTLAQLLAQPIQDPDFVPMARDEIYADRVK